MRARWAWRWAATLLVIGAGASACTDDGPVTVAPATTSVTAAGEDGPGIEPARPAGVAGGGHDGMHVATSTTAAVGGAAAGRHDGVVYQPGDTMEFRASEFAFGPATLTAVPGNYHGVLVNDGLTTHDITFGDGEPTPAGPGETVEFEFTVPPGGVDFVCSQPGHALIGMAGRVEAVR